MESGYASAWTAFMTVLTAASTFLATATALEVVCRAGLRVSEVVRLAPSDIRRKDGILEVHRERERTTGVSL